MGKCTFMTLCPPVCLCIRYLENNVSWLYVMYSPSLALEPLLINPLGSNVKGSSGHKMI